MTSRWPGLAAATAAGVLLAGFLNARRFRVVHKVLKLGRVRSPLRLVQLSDLHFGPAHGLGAVRRWVDAAMAAAPDLIVVTGDFVDEPLREGELEALCQELSRLRAPLGVWAVLGNHDHHAFARLGSSLLAGALAEAGITLLENRGVLVRDDLFVAGVDDLWLGWPDLGSAFDGAPRDAAWLLLSHNPDLLPRVPERVDLTLSGHTHGGQVAVPWVGAPHSGSSFRGRFLSGFVRGPALAHVTNGLGTTKVPFRLGAPAELPVLSLEPAG